MAFLGIEFRAQCFGPPREDAHVAAWPLAQEAWYDQDHLVRAMRPYFPEVDVLPSSPEPRQMLLFRRRKGGTP